MKNWVKPELSTLGVEKTEWDYEMNGNGNSVMTCSEGHNPNWGHCKVCTVGSCGLRVGKPGNGKNDEGEELF